MGLVGHAETFRLQPLGNWGPSDAFEGFEQGSDYNVLQGLAWRVGAVQDTSAESPSLRGWKRQTGHVCRRLSTVACVERGEGGLEWAQTPDFSTSCGERKGRH